MIYELKLPIYTEGIDSVTDCWIYNRLAIIKTSPYYRDWIASHYNLYSASGNFHFGETKIYSPSYHEEILQRRPLKVFEMNSSNIVDIRNRQIKPREEQNQNHRFNESSLDIV